MKQLVLLILCCLVSIQFPAYASGQDGSSRKVTGTVVDKAGVPVAGAYIVLKNTDTGTTTDSDGRFVVEATPESVIEVSFLGFKTQEVTVGNRTDLSITLAPDVQGLDAVVVMGYGVQQKKHITGATVQVKGSEIERLSNVDVLSSLQSQTPGVSITPNSGMPGDGFKVNIRGLGTTGSSNPLYVIDGVAGGDIQNLSPSDIESIDVLKDAASSAIYGSRAANGVIIVTTKQGKEGKPHISYDTYYGIQNAYRMPVAMTAKEYMSIQNEINFNEGSPAIDYATRLPVIYKKIESGEFNGTDWLNEIRNKNALVYSHALNLTGGSSRSTYSLGFSYTSQDGIFGKQVDPNYERYTFRINSSYILLRSAGHDVIKIGENFTFTHKLLDRSINVDDIYWNDIYNMMTMTPLMPVYNSEGGYYALADKQKDQWDVEGTAANPVALMDYRSQSKEKSYSMLANVYLEIQPVKNLIFRSSFGYKKEDGSYRSYSPEYALSSTTTNTNDSVNQSAYSGHGWTIDNTLSYEFAIKDSHHFNILVGQSAEKSGIGESVGAGNANSIFGNSFDHAWVDNTTNTDTNLKSASGSPWVESMLASFFGRINYNYNDKYLLSVVMRADGSSNFARGNRWGYFPSVSAGWVLTNEKFMERAKNVLDFLKIRASWGQNGNCDIGALQYSAQINMYAPYMFGLDKNIYATGAYLKQLANSDIKWETSDQIDIGLDARFFRSRLGFTFDWYNKKTIDMLVQAPGLDIWGTDPPMINGGDIRNKGFELTLSWDDTVRDFSYGFSFNLSGNRNEVVKINNDEGIIHGPENVLADGMTEIFRAQEGYPIGYFWGYKTAGVFQNAEQLASTPVKLGGSEVGDLIFVDTNGDNTIDERDKTMIGNPHPKVTLGFNANFAWKGIDLSITTYGAFGHQVARSIRNYNTQDIFQRWHGEGTSNRFPRLNNANHPNWSYFSDIYVEDADYFKIKNITLGYDFKQTFRKLPFGQLRIYFSAQNLFTFTGYSGMDPEIGYSAGADWAQGVDIGYYPTARVYMVGLNFKF